MANPLAGGLRTERSRTGDLIGSFALSYLVAVLLLASLVYFGNVWEVLANSRFLDFLIRVGIIKYHDKNLGFVEGVPDHKYYLKSQLPVDWLLVGVAAGLFIVFWFVKALEFHGTARFFGVKGSFGQHVRAYLYGLGLSRFFPYDLGDVATVDALRGQGQDEDRATAVVFTGKLLVLFQIGVFGLIGLLARGWTPWLAQVFWSVVILVVLALWLRGTRSVRQYARTGDAAAVVRSLATVPRVLVKLCLLALMAFLLEDIIVYVIANAFGIGIQFRVLIMGLVGGYVARLIPLTPGGVGQFEWGFAMALWLGGVGIEDAVTVAILDNLIRYLTGTLVLGPVMLWHGIETNLHTVLEKFTRSHSQEAAA